MHINWAEFWVIVAFMFLCIQIGRLDERRLQKKPKKVRALRRHRTCGSPVIDYHVGGIPSWKFPTCVLAANHPGDHQTETLAEAAARAFSHHWACDRPGCMFTADSLDPAEVSRIAFMHRYTKAYGGHGA